MSDPLNANDDIVLLYTDNPLVKLEFDITKKQFCGAWVDGHHKENREFGREVYLEIAKKYVHVDGIVRI
jgi:uncharacterized lipoprotein YddW (UPF0748 family)